MTASNLLLTRRNSLLLIVDIQEKLAQHVEDAAGLIRNTLALAEAAFQLGVPVLVTEQYRRGLGATVAAVAESAAKCGAETFQKFSFNAAADESIRQAVTAYGKRDIVICGSEAHVCVLQTAMGLIDLGLHPVVAADAVASRKIFDRDIALHRMRDAGIALLTTEMIMFEWLERADTPEFRKLLPTIRALTKS